MEVNKIKKSNLFLSRSDISKMIRQYLSKDEANVEDYKILKASENMMGFLAEYWKLHVVASIGSNRQILHFFIKSACRSNERKEAMVKEMKLFEKEAAFYEKIQPCLAIQGCKAWCPKLVASFENDLVLEDLTATGYTVRHKFEPFDLDHCKQTLQTLAIFHAGSITYEEKVKNSGRPSYKLLDDFQPFLHKGGYTKDSQWYLQNMNGTLEALQTFSTYRNTQDFDKIIEKWRSVWQSALDLSNENENCRNVICHRDLWTNNFLYHYDTCGHVDGCVLVDFQAARYTPPAGDIMLFLYCSNTDSATLEELLPDLLLHYYTCLSTILLNSGIRVDDVFPFEELVRTAEDQRKWGLVISCCLLPQIWMGDDQMTKIFTNSENFERVMMKEKGKFIVKMMTENEKYREKVLERFEEVARRYILNVSESQI